MSNNDTKTVAVRGVSAGVWRRAKSMAAELDLTLGELVTRALVRFMDKEGE